ncbi:MAG: hypothetical protein KAS32_30715 [Candidatus Peribacteraceae bacterium]|nr:hypothetical protein [Candidatus Peribacteraceae bacterium]
MTKYKTTIVLTLAELQTISWIIYGYRQNQKRVFGEDCDLSLNEQKLKKKLKKACNPLVAQRRKAYQIGRQRQLLNKKGQ